jgi:hypothetical protein
MIIFPLPSRTAITIASLCTFHADILDVATHLSCLLWGKGHSCQRVSLPPKVKVSFSRAPQFYKSTLTNLDVELPSV